MASLQDAESSRRPAAIEFALLVPVLLLMYLGGYELTQALSTYRKLTDTTTGARRPQSGFSNPALSSGRWAA